MLELWQPLDYYATFPWVSAFSFNYYCLPEDDLEITFVQRIYCQIVFCALEGIIIVSAVVRCAKYGSEVNEKECRCRIIIGVINCYLQYVHFATSRIQFIFM